MVAELMVGKAAEVIAERDIAGAAELARADEEMDHLRRRRSASCSAPTGSTASSRPIDIALLGRYYERIADHAVSVANRVVYVVTGEAPLPRA